MAFNSEDLGFSASYTASMAPLAEPRERSQTPSLGTSTPSGSVFGTSVESTASDTMPTTSTITILRRTTDLGEHGNCSKYSCNPLPHHGRSFPKPKAEINVDEGLARKPGRWTLQGQREANLKRAQAHEARMEDQKAQEQEKRRLDLEKTKAELLAMKEELKRVARPRQEDGF
jgi:hypothetical protein